MALETTIQANEDNMALLKATNKKSPTVEDKRLLGEHLAENPKLWQHITDLSGKVRDNILSSLASESFLVRESYRHKLAAMRDNLGWQTASEVEKILIEQVCLTWLRLNFIEIVHREKTRESHTIEWGNHWDKVLDSAQKRHLRACESLAKVRKLLAEANLREQQAQTKRSQSTLIAQKVLENGTK
jgi:hypothetical protein